MSTAASIRKKKAKVKTPAGAKKRSPVFVGMLIVFAIIALLYLVSACQFILIAHVGHHDTRYFWASGHLLAHGHNPYDEDAVERMQETLGILVTGNDVVRNPPYALFLTIPLGFLEPWATVPVWSLMLAVCLGFSVLAMRATLDEPYSHRYLWLAWCFAPAILSIEMGQTGVVLLLGLALFLRWRERYVFWAGAALSLCAFKPHLFLPFGVVLLLWVVARRRWLILAGAAAALAIESGIAMAFDHAIWAHYFAAMRTQGIEQLDLPTFGGVFRMLVDANAVWLEFVPAVLGCAWALWYFWRNRERWDWRTHGSLLTLVSMVVAPYSWFSDQAIALPAILFALLGAKKPRRGSLTLLLALMVVAIIAREMTDTLYFIPFMWLGLAWLVWYMYATSGPAKDTKDTLVAG